MGPGGDGAAVDPEAEAVAAGGVDVQLGGDLGGLEGQGEPCGGGGGQAVVVGVDDERRRGLGRDGLLEALRVDGVDGDREVRPAPEAIERVGGYLSDVKNSVENPITSPARSPEITAQYTPMWPGR